MSERVDVLVLGAGGAGLFCAGVVGQHGRSVAVLDHNAKPGRKILISGGGRCNFTNLAAGPANYHSRNPHFCRSALARYTPADFLALVERHGIAWEERRHRQLFCTGSAQEILDLLLAECRNGAVRLELGTTITSVGRDGDGFTVETTRGTWQAAALVLATGGLSIPTIGASDLGFRLARQFGLPVVPTVPALVPFTLAPADLPDLSGIALEATATCNGATWREALLFTHGGLSGPVTLQVSCVWQPGQAVAFDLLPDLDVAQQLADWKRAKAKATLPNLMAELLPRRLVTQWAARFAWPDSVHHLTEADVRRIADSLNRWTVVPAGTQGYRTAEVTRGGIDTDALSSKTMEAKAVPGLYAIGEVVDVTGWLGGFNFQWAWASAHAAAMALATR